MKKRLFSKTLLFPIMAALLVIPTAADMAVAYAEEESVKEIGYVTVEEGKHKYDVYYDDSFFDHDASEYSPQLASLSIFMAKFSMNKGGTPDNPDDMPEYYKNQPKRLGNFFEQIGFENYTYNDDYTARTDFDTIGIACASKQVNGYTVVAVTVRSGGYYREWSNNMWLGDGSKSDMMHEGWYDCAKKVETFVENYISDKKVNGDVKLWLAGFSRGGAVINLASAFIDQKIYEKKYNIFEGANINVTKDHVYAYTFEAAQGANINSKTMRHPRDEAYNNIFNIVNPNDLVTKVGMSAWGFTRFGVDKFIATEFFDPNNYEFDKKVTEVMYKDKDHDENDDLHYDDLQPYESSGILSKLSSASTSYYITEGIITIIQAAGAGAVPYWVCKDDDKVNYDGNVLMTIVLDMVCEKIGSRDNYVTFYQSLIKDLMLQAMTDNKELDDYTIGKTIWHVALEIISLFPLLTIPAIILNLTATRSNVSWERAVPALLLLKSVYDEIPSELLTLAFNVGNIFDNHSTNLNVAHVCAQDQLYVDYYNKKESRTDLKLIPLLDDATFERLRFKDFNQLYLYEFSGKGVADKTQIAQVDGKSVFSGEVKFANKGTAVGLYCYDVSTFMEVFLPANKKYNFGTKSFSLKPVHNVYMEGYTYWSNAKGKTGDNYYKESLPSSEKIESEYFWFDSSYFYRDISVKSI